MVHFYGVGWRWYSLSTDELNLSFIFSLQTKPDTAHMHVHTHTHTASVEQWKVTCSLSPPRDNAIWPGGGGEM